MVRVDVKIGRRGDERRKCTYRRYLQEICRKRFPSKGYRRRPQMGSGKHT